jgi:hypothetical protein
MISVIRGFDFVAHRNVLLNPLACSDLLDLVVGRQTDRQTARLAFEAEGTVPYLNLPIDDEEENGASC